MLADFAADLPAVLFRHHNVEQNHVRLVHTEGRHALHAVRSGFDLVALLLQIHPQKVAYVFVVVDDENFRHHISIPPLSVFVHISVLNTHFLVLWIGYHVFPQMSIDF